MDGHFHWKKFLHEVQYYELYNKEGNIHFITGISKINTNHLSTYQIEWHVLTCIYRFTHEWKYACWLHAHLIKRGNECVDEPIVINLLIQKGADAQVLSTHNVVFQCAHGKLLFWKTKHSTFFRLKTNFMTTNITWNVFTDTSKWISF